MTQEKELEKKIIDKLWKIEQDIDFVKGVMVCLKTLKSKQDMLEIINEHPDATSSRLLLVAIALAEYEEENGLR